MTNDQPATAASAPAEGTWNQAFAEDAARSIDRMTDTAARGLPVMVRELVPGDKVVNGSVTATFVQQAEHPIWTHLRLVIWRMPDGSWSHDALDPGQVVGEVAPMTYDARKRALREALLHRSQW